MVREEIGWILLLLGTVLVLAIFGYSLNSCCGKSP